MADHFRDAVGLPKMRQTGDIVFRAHVSGIGPSGNLGNGPRISKDMAKIMAGISDCFPRRPGVLTLRGIGTCAGPKDGK